MRVIHIVGARPNFMKVAPVLAALKNYSGVSQLLVHTGQHYDLNMSDIFFQQLGLPRPDVSLEVGSGSHAEQTGLIMTRLEKVILDRRPDTVLVYGDVNSTVAAALVCSKLGVRVGHVEAGLRSFDRTMPEEINRLITDQISDLLFTPSAEGDENLLREGVVHEKIHCVGNVMIDTLVRLLPQAPELPKTIKKPYVLVTLHRPSNVDDMDMLRRIVHSLEEVGRHIRVVFPIHPRTRQRIEQFAIALASSERLRLLDPVGYLEFLSLQREAAVVITDSGGIQEETTCLKVPCLTLRGNTERAITVEVGSNVLVGQNPERLIVEVGKILNGKGKQGGIPKLWDGRAGERIADILGRCEKGAPARGSASELAGRENG